MDGLPVTAVEIADEKPRYSAGAMTLLQKIRAFYEDPENEAAFQKWKAEQNKKGVEATAG